MIGFYTFEEEFEVLRKWTIAINNFSKKFPESKLFLKFHPSKNEDDKIKFNRINKYFLENCSNLQILDNNENAIKWIIMSKTIVSDYSTTQWFAKHFESKNVISMDYKNYPTSGDMKKHNNIVYFEKNQDIVKYDFSKKNYIYDKNNYCSLTQTIK